MISLACHLLMQGSVSWNVYKTYFSACGYTLSSLIGISYLLTYSAQSMSAFICSLLRFFALYFFPFNVCVCVFFFSFFFLRVSLYLSSSTLIFGASWVLTSSILSSL